MNLWKISTVALTLTLGTVVAFPDLVRPAAADKQPHMKAALQSLNQAKNQLEKATPDKGGHRAKAIELVDQAIGEVKEGIEFDNKH